MSDPRTSPKFRALAEPGAPSCYCGCHRGYGHDQILIVSCGQAFFTDCCNCPPPLFRVVMKGD